MSYLPVSGVTSQPLTQRMAPAQRPVILDVPLAARHLSGLEAQGLARTLGGLDAQGLARTLGDGGDGLGDDAPTADQAALLAQIKAQLDAQDRARKIAMYVGIGSAIFAAVRLGLIAFPHVRKRLSRG